MRQNQAKESANVGTDSSIGNLHNLGQSQSFAPECCLCARTEPKKLLS
jgi:hypothetical protein